MTQKPQVNIMIVDDHEVIRYGLTMALDSLVSADAGIEPQIVATVSTGKEVFDKLPFLNVQLLLLDVVLPDMNGLDLVQRLRQIGYDRRRLPILIMTELERINVKEVFEKGANGYISKDEEGGTFIQAIEAIVKYPDTPWLHPNKAKQMLRVEYSLKASGLTGAEISVLYHINLPTQEIAEILNISPKTVRNHLTNIYEKLNVNSRNEALSFVRKIGLIP